MTAPRQARKASTNGPRTYAWPPLEPHEFEVISVTSAISGGFPKPFLVGWAAKVTAERAVNDHAIVGAMLAKGDDRSALKHLKDARWGDAGAKADRGTIVHTAFERYLADDPLMAADVDALLTEARVPSGLRKATHGMVDALIQFLDDEEPEVFWSEATVYSREHGYAGTADLICRMRVGGTMRNVILDVKTSKSIYDETALQLCAYARADFVGLDDGSEVPLTPNGEPIEYGVVVRPMANGRYEKAVFTLTDDVFDLFLASLRVATLEPRLSGARRPS